MIIKFLICFSCLLLGMLISFLISHFRSKNLSIKNPVKKNEALSDEEMEQVDREVSLQIEQFKKSLPENINYQLLLDIQRDIKQIKIYLEMRNADAEQEVLPYVSIHSEEFKAIEKK